ncbi:MAG: glutamine-hydrolyzing GMP synthase [Candidatus Neomarinimicrobiota bacterium]
MSKNDTIIILDFGSQYTQLIARRVREVGVFSVILPCNIDIDRIKSLNPKGIILSGGPETVTESGTSKINTALFDTKIPLLGICYGMQTMAQELGGSVIQSNKREFGHANIEKTSDSKLFDGINFQENSLNVWMSHGDKVSMLPDNFDIIAKSENCSIAGFAHSKEAWFGLQFHPEVTHTNEGIKIIENFVYKICNCEKNWDITDIIDGMQSYVNSKVENEKVILGLSGGVDSSVVAMLLHQCIKENLTCIFVDNGLLRLNEVEEVLDTFSEVGINVHLSSASDLFLSRLKGIKDPEQKRIIIGNTFIEVFEEEAKKIDNVNWLAQGTIYPDVIESSASETGNASVIKSHHNVGGLPERMNLNLLEPLRDLFKDEVRNIGKNLGVPSKILGRHPFPGPGLAIRIMGEVKKERLDILRIADKIFIDELITANLYDNLSQAFVVYLPVKSVGVVGDARRYEDVLALRAVRTVDFMTATWADLPYNFVAKVSNRIVNEISQISRVVYDCTGKPPATIEWE